MNAVRWMRPVAGAAALVILLAGGCRREVSSNFDNNFPPETFISRAPAESTLTYYRVHVYWNGADTDGVIDHYEYAVTDSNKTPGMDTPGFVGYYRTARTDSVFHLTADNPQILGHRFYVRAVDNEGKVDPTPAWAYFIADNYNFPNVVFKKQVGRWEDGDGVVHTLDVTSSARFLPTDTIGVGGTLEVSWTGFDQDVGGSVVGFVYRLSEDFDYGGGSLADTSVTLDFSPQLVSGQYQYFSGTQAVQVRAIDDAGARTQPDSVRSVVVNFNPVTWIVDPASPFPPRHRRVFTDRSTGAVYPSGTTLAMDATGGFRGIEFHATGFDDPREKSVGAEDNAGLTQFSWRRLKNGGGPAWTPRGVESWTGYPDLNLFDMREAQSLDTGDYSFLLRSRDVLGRWGYPETLMVRINYDPFFTAVDYFTPSGDLRPVWIPPTPGSRPDTSVITIAQNPDGSYPEITMRFEALDLHEPPPDTHPLDTNVVVETETSFVTEYRSRLNGARNGFEAAEDGIGTWSFMVSTEGASGRLWPGLNQLKMAVRDARERIGFLEVHFLVNLVPYQP